MTDKPSTKPAPITLNVTGDIHMPLPQEIIDALQRNTDATTALTAELQKERAGTAGSIPAADVPGLVALIDAETAKLQALIPAT